MLTGVLVLVAVVGIIAALVVMFVQRGRDGLDVSLRGLLRVYLYLASLAGVIVLAVGVSGIFSFVIASAFGLDVVYGGPPPQPVPAIAPACPPGASCPPSFNFPQPPRPDDRVRRQSEDLVRGVTFVVFGAVFWIAHWTARRGLVGVDERGSGLYRGYLMLGTVIFGVATIALLPYGIYQALSYVLVPAQAGVFRQGAGDALSGGLAALPLWLLYLWLVQRALRTPAPPPPTSSTLVP